MSSSTGGSAIHIVDGVTVVDCQKQVRSWSLLRSIVKFLIPSCNHNFSEEQQERRRGEYYNDPYQYYLLRRRRLRSLIPSNINTNLTNTTKITNITTGTIFGYRRGKVNFCIQSNPNSSTPILLLELAIPTAILAKEMQSGLLRIALECNYSVPTRRSSSLLSMPVWTMNCNGRKVGFAINRVPTQADKKVLRLMQSVVEGVGIISGKKLINSDEDDKQHDHDDLMYLRANFERVSGSSDSESFHLINPDGSNSQQLSIFFLRTS
ncbi:Protein of unknown function DUF617 [Macleaya cordata]|uniref:Protein MIZU-KUSSEI 1 n=1 Tax=Macleaya cordata TaxID=56857 RepID=A0A200RDW0_MACCD|nr:Protein of unknown function DUF617 [Macleaya cordata]